MAQHVPLERALWERCVPYDQAGHMTTTSSAEMSPCLNTPCAETSA
jgi:hypothetical protein